MVALRMNKFPVSYLCLSVDTETLRFLTDFGKKRIYSDCLVRDFKRKISWLFGWKDLARDEDEKLRKWRAKRSVLAEGRIEEKSKKNKNKKKKERTQKRENMANGDRLENGMNGVVCRIKPKYKVAHAKEWDYKFSLHFFARFRRLVGWAITNSTKK